VPPDGAGHYLVERPHAAHVRAGPGTRSAGRGGSVRPCPSITPSGS